MTDFRFGYLVAALQGGKPSDYFASLTEPTEDQGPDGRALINFLKMYQALRDRKKRG